jgi:hypothetical protein
MLDGEKPLAQKGSIYHISNLMIQLTIAKYSSPETAVCGLGQSPINYLQEGVVEDNFRFADNPHKTSCNNPNDA